MNIQKSLQTTLLGVAAVLLVTGGAFAQSEMTDKIRLENNANAQNKYDFSVVGGNLGITRTDGASLVNGQVGIGTTAPAFDLHVVGSDADTRVTVENLTGPAGDKTMFNLRANDKVRFSMSTANNSSGCDVSQTDRCVWTFDNDNNFTINDVGDGTNEFILTGAGNLTIKGALTQNSDIRNKTALETISEQDVLDKVAGLEVLKWSYKEEPGVRHLGPTAQGFHAAFGLGPTENGITSVDADGVSLASIKALYSLVKQQQEQLAVLQARLQELEAAK